MGFLRKSLDVSNFFELLPTMANIIQYLSVDLEYSAAFDGTNRRRNCVRDRDIPFGSCKVTHISQPHHHHRTQEIC